MSELAGNLSSASLDLRSLGALLEGSGGTPLTILPLAWPQYMPTRRTLLPLSVLICKEGLHVAVGKSSMTHVP